MSKIARKYLAHFISTTFNAVISKASTYEYERLGADLEEYNVELNPDTETGKNILGETTFKHNGYEATSEADPYYADTASGIFKSLQEIIDNRYDDDNCKAIVLEVQLWNESSSTEYVAYAQEAYIVPSSYGGDTSGYQIPFTVNYLGERVKGVWDTETKTFTPSAA